MSHPYWPQPKYLYQRAQPHGPYPSAMGDYGSRYTHGSFSRVRNYALPDYVAAERTGLEGDDTYIEDHPFEHGSAYYGFGGNDFVEVGGMICSPTEFIEKFIGQIPSSIRISPPDSVKKALEYIPGAKEAAEIEIPIREPINEALGTVTDTIARNLFYAIKGGQSAFQYNWFRPNISYRIEKITGIPQLAFEAATVGQIFKLAKNAMLACMKKSGISSFQDTLADPEYVKRLACQQNPTLPGCSGEMQMHFVKPRYELDIKQAQPGEMIDFEEMARTGQLTPTSTPGWTYIPGRGWVEAPTGNGVAPSEGLPTVALVGAAALAALLLLR